MTGFELWISGTGNDRSANAPQPLHQQFFTYNMDLELIDFLFYGRLPKKKYIYRAASVTIINLNRARGTRTKTVTITKLNSLTATSQLPSKCKTSNKKASH